MDWRIPQWRYSPVCFSGNGVVELQQTEGVIKGDRNVGHDARKASTRTHVGSDLKTGQGGVDVRYEPVPYGVGRPLV